MTLEDIERQLPNGLHDADLKSFAVDLANATLRLEIEADGSVYPEREFRPLPVSIVISGLCYFKLDPPDVLHDGVMEGASWINAGDDPIDKGLLSADVAAKLPKGSFLHWIFLKDWNALLVLAGSDAKLERIHVATEN